MTQHKEIWEKITLAQRLLDEAKALAVAGAYGVMTDEERGALSEPVEGVPTGGPSDADGGLPATRQ